MVNNKENELTANQGDARQQLVWKGGVVLLCLGLFALMMWSGARENATAEQCANADQAAREVCMASLRVLAPQPPVKGGRPLDAAERRAN